MKKISICILMFALFATSPLLSNGQGLTPAKKVPPQMVREGVINATFDEVWDLISVLDKVDEYNSELVESVEKEGDGYEAYRLCKFKDGTERGEDIVVFTKKNGRICFNSGDSQYPVDHFIVNYYMTPSGRSKCKLKLEAYFKVSKGAGKTKTYKAIGKELSATVKGVQSYFAN